MAVGCLASSIKGAPLSTATMLSSGTFVAVHYTGRTTFLTNSIKALEHTRMMNKKTINNQNTITTRKRQHTEYTI